MYSLAWPQQSWSGFSTWLGGDPYNLWFRSRFMGDQYLIVGPDFIITSATVEFCVRGRTCF